MLDRQLHKFYISYRINGEVHLEWIDGINLRHAKERIEMLHEEASDLMDWTNEKEEDLQLYLSKIEAKKIAAEESIRQKEKDNPAF
jgi:hypothetical protein